MLRSTVLKAKHFQDCGGSPDLAVGRHKPTIALVSCSGDEIETLDRLMLGEMLAQEFQIVVTDKQSFETHNQQVASLRKGTSEQLPFATRCRVPAVIQNASGSCFPSKLARVDYNLCRS